MMWNVSTSSLDGCIIVCVCVLQSFTMETFAGPVFASLRSSLGMTEQEYHQSLCSESCYLQFISNSKSKADFFLTLVTVYLQYCMSNFEPQL